VGSEAGDTSVMAIEKRNQRLDVAGTRTDSSTVKVQRVTEECSSITAWSFAGKRPIVPTPDPQLSFGIRLRRKPTKRQTTDPTPAVFSTAAGEPARRSKRQEGGTENEAREHDQRGEETGDSAHWAVR